MTEKKLEEYPSAIPLMLLLAIAGFALIGYVYWKGYHD